MMFVPSQCEEDAPAAPLMPPCTPLAVRKTNLFATPQHPTRLELNMQYRNSQADHYSRFNKQFQSPPGQAFVSTPMFSPPTSSSSIFSSSPYRQPNSSPPSSPSTSSPPYRAKEVFQKPSSPSLLSPPMTPVTSQHFSTPKPGSNPTVSYQH